MASMRKLKEFNKVVDPELQVSEAAIDNLATLISGSANTEGIKTLENLIAWPHEYVFPALDILRITIRNQDVCKYFCSLRDFVDLLSQHASQGNPPTCRMLAMRTFANFFRHPEGIELNMRHIDTVLQSAINCKDFNTKNAQVAVASLIINYCVRLSHLDDLESKSKCLQAIGEILVANLDPEAAYRLLVAAGTLAALDDSCKALAHSIDLPDVIKKFQTSDVSKVVECSRLLSHNLSS